MKRHSCVPIWHDAETTWYITESEAAARGITRVYSKLTVAIPFPLEQKVIDEIELIGHVQISFLVSVFHEVEERLQEIGDSIENLRANHFARKRMQAARKSFLQVEAEYEEHGTIGFVNAIHFGLKLLEEAVIGHNASEIHLQPCSKGFLFLINDGGEQKPFVCVRPGSVKAVIDWFKFRASIPDATYKDSCTQTGSFGFRVKGEEYCCHLRFFVHDRYIYPYQQMILRLWSGSLKEHPVSIPWGIYILDKKYEGRSLNEFKESDDFPPPWVLQRDSHPYGTAWEMGVNYLEHFDIWWEKHDFTLQEKISYQ